MTYTQSPKTTQLSARPCTNPFHPPSSRSSGPKKSQKTTANTDATSSKAKPMKPSDHESKKNNNVPVELWGVGAWCDDMPEPEAYKKPKKSNPDTHVAH
ncbi:hypothetical protein PG988_002085 [Apiospora saccharicola]